MARGAPRNRPPATRAWTPALNRNHWIDHESSDSNVKLVSRVGSTSCVGPRVPMTTGALLAATGMFWLSAVTVHANYFADVLGPLVVLAIGLGMAFVSTSVTAISGVQPNESGLASALLSVGRQLGGSLGIAIMGNIATTVTRNQLATGPFTHAAVNRALTTGFSAAFEIAGLIALAGFVTALVAVRHRQSPAIAGPSVEVEVAA